MDSARPKALNGIPADLRRLLEDQVADTALNRDVAGPWSVRSVWNDGFGSVGLVRGHRLEFEEPGDLSARDSAVTPHEWLLASMGSCLVAGVVLHATVANVTLTHLQVDIGGTFSNILHWQGNSVTEHPGYRSLDVQVTLAGDASDDVLHAIWTRAFETSPVTQTIVQPTRVAVTVSHQTSMP